MIQGRLKDVLLALCVGLWCLFLYGATMDNLPFHPDESSWIYMSHDFDTAVSDYGSLRWRREDPVTKDVNYRLLNAPLPKYAIGIGRWLSGQWADSSADWSWLASWEENVSAGALPSPPLLRAARLTAVVIAALSFAIFFLVARDMAGLGAAGIATVLLGTHPIELLHMRRAMAESTLQLFSLLAVLAIVRLVAVPVVASNVRRRLWASLVAGVAVGMAVSAKQNAAAFAALALAAACAAALSPTLSRRRALAVAVSSAGLLTFASLVTFYLLNPVLYDQPIHAGRRMVSMRRMMTTGQARYLGTVTRGSVMPDMIARLNASYREVFWAPPAFSELTEYDDKTAADVAAYNRQPLARAWSSPWARSAFLLLSLFGFVGIVRAIVRDRLGEDTRARQILVAWLVTQTAFVLLFVPMDWQRYFVLLLPPVCVMAADGASKLVRRLSR